MTSESGDGRARVRAAALWRAILAIGCLALASAAALAEPAALAGVALRDQRAAPITRASLDDGPLLLNFVYTSCASICPVQVRDLAAVRRELPSDVRARVRFLSVSVDPEHDTPATLAAFAARMGADSPGWRFATGEPAQIKALLARMQILDPRAVDPKPAQHRPALYLFDADGALVIRYGGMPVDRPRLVAELTEVSRRMPSSAAPGRHPPTSKGYEKQ